MHDVRAIVTDIEGTTSSISFVHDVLFPYARKHLPVFIEASCNQPEVQHWLHEAAREAGLVDPGRLQVVELLLHWIDEDRKSTALKALQGMIWEAGYVSGAYRAHVYPEVAAKLRSWHARGLRLYVYSSGSVAAQRLFFHYSEAGDLSPLFDGYFDTQTGAKRDSESYRRIGEAIGVAPGRILFLSDVVQELDAARSAGWQTAQIVRAPLPLPETAAHPVRRDFDAIDV